MHFSFPAFTLYVVSCMLLSPVKYLWGVVSSLYHNRDRYLSVDATLFLNLIQDLQYYKSDNMFRLTLKYLQVDVREYKRILCYTYIVCVCVCVCMCVCVCVCVCVYVCMYVCKLDFRVSVHI